MWVHLNKSNEALSSGIPTAIPIAEQCLDKNELPDMASTSQGKGNEA